MKKMNTNTKSRYLDAMTWISKQEQFNNDEFLKRFNVSKSLIYYMVKLDFVKKIEHGVYKWSLGFEPKLVQVHALRKIANTHNEKRRQKRLEHQKQLTIQPLKRVERIAPVRQPVQVEEQHTPYPIMDIVIAFLAGMICAGFITLIWK